MDGWKDSYSFFEVEDEQGRIVDFRIHAGENDFLLLGPYAFRRLEDELERVREKAEDSLLVLLGAGTPDYLATARRLWAGPLAVVDKERELSLASGTRDIPGSSEILWVDAEEGQEAVNTLTRWQMGNNARSFCIINLPAYFRLDSEYYRFVYESLKASRKFDFWARTRYPRFQGELPRILLISSKYFLMGEIQSACRRMGVPHYFLQLPHQELGRQEYVHSLLEAVLEFRPDFVLTINHLGVDKEGVLLELLDKMRLPLASWFVDNPHLILYLYQNLQSPWTAIFTWDRDNLSTLRQRGFEHLSFLPLATDCERFVSMCGRSGLQNDVGFVGNSMLHKVRGKLRDTDLPLKLRSTYEQVGQAFTSSLDLTVEECLRENLPHLWEEFVSLADMESRLGYETLVTWEATRIYREKCIRQLLDFHPLIAGDDGWLEMLADSFHWTRMAELNYYSELPYFYPRNRINFNCTSAQMKGAVNQRLFDVPASGSFLLTDYRRQMEELFDVSRETVCFEYPEEIPELIRYYLDHPEKREETVQAARRRILSDHTYEVRVQELMREMKRLYA